jgi:hypothetical protein
LRELAQHDERLREWDRDFATIGTKEDREQERRGGGGNQLFGNAL